MLGHGGDEFLKFQDSEEITGQDLADIFEQMWQQRRYRRVLFMADTCQANTLFERFYSPNIVAIGSSRRDENSYSVRRCVPILINMADSFCAASL